MARSHLHEGTNPQPRMHDDLPRRGTVERHAAEVHSGGQPSSSAASNHNNDDHDHHYDNNRIRFNRYIGVERIVRLNGHVWVERFNGFHWLIR